METKLKAIYCFSTQSLQRSTCASTHGCHGRKPLAANSEARDALPRTAASDSKKLQLLGAKSLYGGCGMHWKHTLDMFLLSHELCGGMRCHAATTHQRSANHGTALWADQIPNVLEQVTIQPAVDTECPGDVMFGYWFIMAPEDREHSPARNFFGL